jgi:membrane fusion protein
MTEPQRPSLFRTEALAHQTQHRLLGDIVLARPLSLAALTWIALAVGVTIIGFLAVGSYTRKATVAGQLAPDKGLIRITAPAQSAVTQRLFQDGQRVTKGMALYELSLDRTSSGRVETEAEVGRQVKARIASLQEQLDKQMQLFDEQAAALKKRSERLQEELQQAKREAQLAQQRASLSAATVARFEDLQRQKFMPELQVREKQQLLIEHQMEQRSLQRQVTTVQRQLEDVQAELASAPAKDAAQRAALQRELATAEQELAQSDARREVVVTAPVDGIVTASLALAGNSVPAGATLATIVPDGSHLQAELFASSKAIGFVQEGVPVLLRYTAFPHQKFGHQSGRVVAVSQAPIALADLPADRAGAGESLYRITVAVDAQSMAAHGKHWALAPGMTVEADLLLDRRRLYEWLLEPLSALRS